MYGRNFAVGKSTFLLHCTNLWFLAENVTNWRGISVFRKRSISKFECELSANHFVSKLEI